MFKVGDVLKTTKEFKREGLKLFGKEFKLLNYTGKVKKVYANEEQLKDSQGDLIDVIYEFEDGEVIKDSFLELVKHNNFSKKRKIIQRFHTMSTEKKYCHFCEKITRQYESIEFNSFRIEIALCDKCYTSEKIKSIEFSMINNKSASLIIE